MSQVLALENALQDVTVAPRDVAAVALARRYAWDIDEAELVSMTADKWLSEVKPWMDPVQYERIKALLARIERTQVLALLGPKLLVTYTELGLTPRSRADKPGREGGTSDVQPGSPEPQGRPPSSLARQRAERAARLGRRSGGEHSA